MQCNAETVGEFRQGHAYSSWISVSVRRPLQSEYPFLTSGRSQGTGSPPSPTCFDTVYLCQQRQDWYRTLCELRVRIAAFRRSRKT